MAGNQAVVYVEPGKVDVDNIRKTPHGAILKVRS